MFTAQIYFSHKCTVVTTELKTVAFLWFCLFPTYFFIITIFNVFSKHLSLWDIWKQKNIFIFYFWMEHCLWFLCRIRIVNQMKVFILCCCISYLSTNIKYKRIFKWTMFPWFSFLVIRILLDNMSEKYIL